MVPLYFHFMEVSTYGAWLATGNIVSMLGLLESGFASVITQKMASEIANNNEKGFLQYAGANIFSALIISSSLCIVGLAVSPFVVQWVNADTSIYLDLKIAFIISVLSSSVSILVSLFGAFPQVWQETKTIGFINTGANLAGILAMVISLFCGLGIIALAIGYLLRSLLNFGLQGLWIVYAWKRKKIGKPIYEQMIVISLVKDCVYPFLSRITSVLSNNTQSFILAALISPSVSAIYDITSKVCQASISFVSMMNGSFFAMFSLTFSSRNSIEINKVVKQVTRSLSFILSSVLLYTLCFTKPIIYFWVGQEKFGGNFLLLLIVISSFISTLKLYFNNLLYTGGYINKSSKLDIINLLFYLLLLFVSIHFLGVYSLPSAALISSIFFLIGYLYLLKKYLYIRIRPINIFILKDFFIVCVFAMLHFILKINIVTFKMLIIYLLLFSFIYVSLSLLLNLNEAKSIAHMYVKSEK